ncbi:hypothetical protein BKA67DRAFT_656947 [Truncatella angustata]|uniref:Uncharacterized protein n=1 Tax=Truncatella angustata TaxID=152316 RepID=A0A9P8UML1_9PEZI|nr:uncharacterized protein BKA67DRAFT_656947 [Truncatella angustata]KAH6654978.1 hypothetical protein BKA67DRAFT_656947 [Truncatella angustata]
MSPDHHLPKEQHTKLRECTNRVIPLCAAILVIFSIGGGLGYTFNQQALPRNAVVGISITFLALGLAFGIGWLKIHYSTHESHISRLEAARSAYERIRQDTGNLHNRVSRLFGASPAEAAGTNLEGFFPVLGQAEQGLYHVANDDSTPLAKTQGIALDATHAASSQGQEGNIRRAAVRAGPYPRKRGHGGLQNNGTSSLIPTTRSTFISPPLPPLPPSPALRPDRSDHEHPWAPAEVSDSGSMSKTPPHMIAQRKVAPTAAGSGSGSAHYIIYEQQRPPRLTTGHMGYQPAAYSPGVAPVDLDTGAPGSPAPCPDQQDPALSTNLAFLPDDLGQAVLQDLQEPQSPVQVDRTMRRVATLTRMPKTQKDIDDGAGGLMLPRSSSRNKTGPLPSLRVSKPANEGKESEGSAR